MSDTHSSHPAAEHGAAHGGGHGEHGAEGHNHPGPRRYIEIAMLLGIITAIEVALYYIPSVRPLLVPSLLLLSALKFAIVVAFYMHLKFDHALFTKFFVAFMILAGFMITALMALFHQKLGGPIH